MWSRFTISCPDLSTFTAWQKPPDAGSAPETAQARPGVDREPSAPAHSREAHGAAPVDHAVDHGGAARPDRLGQPCRHGHSHRVSPAEPRSDRASGPPAASLPAPRTDLPRPAGSPRGPARATDRADASMPAAPSAHRIILSRAQRRAPAAAPRASMAQARRLQLDPGTPPQLKAQLERWTVQHAIRADELMAHFKHHFRPLAALGGPDGPQRFDTEVLPSLREAAVVCVALNVDRMSRLRRLLRGDVMEDRGIRLLGPCFTTPTTAAAVLLACLGPDHLPAITELKERQEAPDGGVEVELGWTIASLLLVATPLLAALDSLLDGLRRHLHGARLLNRQSEFHNPLARQLHEAAMLTERREALKHAWVGGLLGGITRAAALPAIMSRLSPPMDADTYVAIDLVTACVTLDLLATYLRKDTRPVAPHPLTREFMLLSGTDFAHRAVQIKHKQCAPPFAVSSLLREIAAGFVRPSTYVRAALGVAPFMACHALSLAVLPYPIGAKIGLLKRYGEEPPPSEAGVAPVTAMLLGGWATILWATTVVTSQSVRAWAERRLDAPAERLAQRAWHALMPSSERAARPVASPEFRPAPTP